MDIQKLKELLRELKTSRFGLDEDDGVKVIKTRILVEYDNDWHTLAGIINKIEDILEEKVQEKNDQYKCPSYFDDSNILKNCTCGKCV